MRVRFALIFAVCTMLGAMPCLPAARAGAYEDRRAQVAAATADAMGALERDVLSANVTGTLTVEQFVEQAHARDDLARVVRRAQQIGGARWLDDKTCQVRLELSGNDVADLLVSIARDKPHDAGLPVDVLQRRLDPLRKETFGATGMSTSAVDALRPPPQRTAWRGVSDTARTAAINEARRSAARQVLQSVGTISVPGDGRLSNIVGDVKVRDHLEGWLMSRPVTSVDFQDDLSVHVAIATEGDAFWDELNTAIGQRSDLGFPRDEKSLSELRRQIVHRVEPTTGGAVAEAPAGGGAANDPGRKNVVPPRDPGRGAVEIPREAPRWTREQLDVHASSKPLEGRLKTARAAEKVAREQLRRQIDDLPLTRSMTLGEAARRDSRINDAIDGVVKRARTRKTNYLSDGGAEVYFTLDLRDVWYGIAGQ
jgi:hypothetical protein